MPLIGEDNVLLKYAINYLRHRCFIALNTACHELLTTSIRRIGELERKLFDLAGAYNYQRRVACQLFDQLNPDNPMTFRPPELKTPEPMEIHLRSLVKESASSLADMEMNLHEARLTISTLRNELNSERFAAQRLLKERDSTQAALNNALVENERLKREVKEEQDAMGSGKWRKLVSWDNVCYPCEMMRQGKEGTILLQNEPHPAWDSAGITHWRPL